MEILRNNYISNTAMMIVNSNTTLAEYIMNPDLSFQWVSNGLNNDATTATLKINFNSTVTVSRIALVGINLKSFRLYYNGVTASTFALESADTSSSNWNQNSETGLFLHVTDIDCTSVSLDMMSTITPNSEKAIGYYVLTREHLDFSRLPAAKNYNPSMNPIHVVHRLSDGNTRIQAIGDRWSHDIKLEYISEDLRDSLKNLYALHESMIFVPFGTSTSWDQVIYPCVWSGPFGFHKFSDNAMGTGFEGAIHLQETNS